jgi:Fur family ferric uptake transcriptional regulator
VTDIGWEQELRSRGYRLTPQRQFVLEAVRRLGHATPDEVGSAVREVATGVNVSTIYRTLELLEELGLVTHTHLGHGAPTYHAADPAGERHVHLVCRRCDAVTEVPSAFFDESVGLLADRFGFHTDVGHLAIFGVCAACGEEATP